MHAHTAGSHQRVKDMVRRVLGAGHIGNSGLRPEISGSEARLMAGTEYPGSWRENKRAPAVVMATFTSTSRRRRR